VDVEKKNSRRGLHAAFEAVRDHFYRGSLAARNGKAVEEAGGLLRAADLAGFRADLEEPTRVTYRGYEICKVGF
jgi:gamma-glutamyltranspeptidase/glutathione hydrolase